MKLFKHIITFLTVFATTFTLALAQSGNVTVSSDKSLTADFDKYKTFNFARQVSDNQIVVYFLEDAILKSNVTEAVQYELEARGYEQASSNPDLVINFQILDKPTEFTGYTGVYRDENYWGTTEMRKDAIGLTPEAEVRTADNQQTYQLEKGTLLIHIVDSDSGELIWQGYASGILNQKNPIGDDSGVKEAVSMIFQTYDWRADDYDVAN